MIAKVFDKAIKDYATIEDEYNNMSIETEIKRKEIKSKIEEQAKRFDEKRKRNRKLFKQIR
ncbi:hypothetical protein [Peribacillus frigoritolerans]|uniref:hypothetical protein n=1 Tax=Peribacillus frigoritolerans TaxID=450367 RepID=UPI002079EA76|nr:hypothetical protein [Peribacillus frigoritolerans]USK66298.1 hypothetical protein LIT26_06615 [Peribacillus frigoritolerans]